MASTITHDYGETNGIRTSDGCEDNVEVRVCDRSQSCSEVDMGDTITQSWKMVHAYVDTNDNLVHAIGNKDHCMPVIQTMKRKQENIGNRHIFDTETTHEKLGSRAYHSASKRGLGTMIGLWNKHMHNRLNDRMTKAYRRGVTCTEIVRICLVSCLYPYLLGSPLFERELE